MTTTTTTEGTKKRTLIPVEQWPDHHCWPTSNALRMYIKRGHVNGLTKSGAVLRIGRRILIDQDRFFAWIDAQNGVK